MDKEKWTFTLKEISRTGWSFRHFFASFVSSYEINADYAPEFYSTDIFLITTTCSTHTNSRIHTDSHAQRKLPYPRSVALLFIHADVKCCNHTKNKIQTRIAKIKVKKKHSAAEFHHFSMQDVRQCFYDLRPQSFHTWNTRNRYHGWASYQGSR